MCRMLLCISPADFELSYPITTAPYSLKTQSYKQYLPHIKRSKNKFKRNPKTNLDGYGIFYIPYNSFELKCNKSKYPIADKKNHITNKNLEPHLKQEVWYCFGVIRNNNFADIIPDRFNHVQPFRYKNILFAHNGGFNTHYNDYTPKMLPYIAPEFIENKLNKSPSSMSAHVIDSMWLFGLFVTYVDFSSGNNEEIISGIHRVLSIMDGIKDNNFNISINVILSDLDNQVHLGIRYRTCAEEPPSLYFNLSHPIVGRIIASEPIDFDPEWRLLNDKSIVILRENASYVYDIDITEMHCLKK